MAYTFQYYIQGTFTGSSRDGDISFVVEKPFTATIDSTNYDYATGAVISLDLNGDYIADGVYDLLHSKVQEYCVRYSIDINTVILNRASVYIQEEYTLARVYFNPTSPSTSTTDRNALAYAYLLDGTALQSPSGLEFVSTTTSVSLFWNPSANAVGYRIYNEVGDVLATIGTEPTEWLHEGLTPDTTYRYRVTSYNANGESGFSEVIATTLGEVEGLPDRVILEDSPPAYEAPKAIVDYESGRIEAFQSGIGDGLDLLTKTDKEHTTRELITYEMQVKGYEIESVQVYEEKEFRYRFVAKDKTTGSTVGTSTWYDGRIDGKEPLTTNGAGKQELRVPIELVGTNIAVTVEMNDPSTFVRMTFEKGVAPTTDYPDDFVTFYSATESSVAREVRRAYYGPKVKGKGIYTARDNEIITIFDEIPSPHYDATFHHVDGTRRDIKEWETIIYTKNPNVRVWIHEEPANYWFQKKFIKIKLKAQIINVTQTPWTPMVHNGYYYLNQSERFLYSESKVQGWYEKAKSYIPLRFSYNIDTFATRNIPGQIQVFLDQYRADFSGSFNNVTLEKIEGDLTLLDNNLTGQYISGPKTFNNTAVYYEPITWESEELHGSSIEVFTQAKTRTGQWTVWAKEVNGEVIKSPLSRELRYRIDMKPGDKKNLTTTEYTDASASEFVLGIYQNENDPVLHENTAIIGETVGISDTELATGIYTSVTFDIGDKVDNLGKLLYKATMPAGIGADVQVFTASSSTDTDWSTTLWQPLFNPIVNIDGSIVGEVQSPPNPFMRYQLRFTRSREEVTLLREVAGDESFNSGTHHNTIALHSTVRLQDTSQSGTYVSPVMEFPHNEAWLAPVFDYTLPYNGGGVVIKTISSDNQYELYEVTHNDPAWVGLGTDGSIQSLPKKYMMVKFDLAPGISSTGNSESPLLHGIKIYADSFVYNTPIVSLVNIKANTYYMTKETPILRSIRIAGKYENIVTQELYTTSLSTEVLSNRELYRISDITIKQIVDNDLLAKNVDRTFLTLNRYELKTKMPGVILTSRDMNDPSIIMDEREVQNGYVYAQTTDVAEEYVYDQIRIKVELDNTAIAAPIPQQGSPIVIRDASGKELVHVPFLDEYGRPTLTYTEEFTTDGRNMIVLTYPNYDIATLKIEYLHEDVGVWQEVSYITADHHFITLDGEYAQGSVIRTSYRLKDSFTVDYEHDMSEELVKIYFHNPTLDTTREVKVWFETNKKSAYYTAKEIDLNPLKNSQHAGFVYLSDKVEPAYKMELYFPTETLYSSGYDTMYVTARVLDYYGNPVVGDVVEFSATDGVLQLIQNKTDNNGLAMARYIGSKLDGPVTITAINRTSHLETRKNLTVKSEKLPARLVVKADKYSVLTMEEVKATAYVVDGNQERVPYIEVTFNGVATTTNYHGEATSKHSYNVTGLQQIAVTVPSLGLSETILIQVNEVS